MKQLFFFLLAAFSCSQCNSQQANNELAKLWSETKLHFLKKGEEGKKIATLAMDSKVVTPDIVRSVLANANRVIVSSGEDVVLDSLHFHGLSWSDDSLDANMKILLTQLDSDKEFALLNTYTTYKRIYQASANRVYAAKSKFNDVASKFKSPYYFSPPKTAMPNIKF